MALLSPLSWIQAAIERGLERAGYEAGKLCLEKPHRTLRARWVNPKIVALTHPLEIPMQTYTTTQRADVPHGYIITADNIYTDGVGDPVAVDPATVALSSSDETVVPQANVRYLGKNAEGKDEIWFKPLNSAPAGATCRVTGSARETGTDDDWYIDYTVGEDALFASLDTASIAPAAADPA